MGDKMFKPEPWTLSAATAVAASDALPDEFSINFYRPNAVANSASMAKISSSSSEQSSEPPVPKSNKPYANSSSNCNSSTARQRQAPQELVDDLCAQQAPPTTTATTTTTTTATTGRRKRFNVPGAGRFSLNEACSSSRRQTARTDECYNGCLVPLQPPMPMTTSENHYAYSQPLYLSTQPWNPNSWKSLPIKQNVQYRNVNKHMKVLNQLAQFPPLVTPSEIVKLGQKLKDVALNRAFLLQGGDCAELFEYTSQNTLESKLKVILQMSLVLVWGTQLPIVRIGRMAGQYAKPRSSQTEILADGRTVLSFRGENVNSYNVNDREPDPNRLIQAYLHSAATLNYIRALLTSGFADLHTPDNWRLQHLKSRTNLVEYEQVVNSVLEHLNFARAIGAEDSPVYKFVEFYTSHEALLLDYESAFTRYYQGTEKGWFDTSAHMVWVGERTRQLNHAHIEFVRGLENPIGVKIGPSVSAEELIALLDILDPHIEPGKVTLITRYGRDRVEEVLPGHILAVQSTRHIPVWCSDPMHGNTRTSLANPGLKTRYFSDIVQELESCFRIHLEHNSRLQGLHFELTGEAGVTECVGGTLNVRDEELSAGFKSFCDPRLNFEQSMDIAFLVAKRLRSQIPMK